MKLKDLIIFIIGAAVGAGGAYVFLSKKVEDEVKKRINEELNKQDEGRFKDKEKEPIKEKQETPDEEPVERTEEDLKKYENVLKKVDYTKPASEKVTTMTDAAVEQAKELVEDAVKKTSKKAKVPKKVTQDEFDATPEDERATLYYYSDGILADDDDHVYDPTETMGATNFKNFKSTYDTVYIFNYAKNFMFEIMQSNSKYSDIIGGDLRN